MSKKITHENIKKVVSRTYNALVYYFNDDNALEFEREIQDYIKQQERDSKLLELYKQAYDKSNAEVLKMFTYEQDEKTTLTNIIGHLDDSKTVVQIKELENE